MLPSGFDCCSTLWVTWDTLFTLSHHPTPGSAWLVAHPHISPLQPWNQDYKQAVFPKGIWGNSSSVTSKPPIISILPRVFSFSLNSLLAYLCIHKPFVISLSAWKLSSMGQMAFKCILVQLLTIWVTRQKLHSFSHLLPVHLNDVRLLKDTYDQMEQGWLESPEEKKSIFMKRRKVHDTKTVHHLSLLLVSFQNGN